MFETIVLYCIQCRPAHSFWSTTYVLTSAFGPLILMQVDSTADMWEWARNTWHPFVYGGPITFDSFPLGSSAMTMQQVFKFA